MTSSDADQFSRDLADDSLASGDPTGWFEQLYAAADRGDTEVPWDRQAPHFLLMEWAQQSRLRGQGRRAIVVGCGLGRDAEFVASRGFDTVAFDVAASGVAAARRRHPDSTVDYQVADLLTLPDHWQQAFDLVLESLTVQSLPVTLRQQATHNVARLVGTGGTLLVIAAARDPHDSPADGPPWPLTRTDVDAFASGDLEPVRVEELPDTEQPTVIRWRAEFRRPLAQP